MSEFDFDYEYREGFLAGLSRGKGRIAELEAELAERDRMLVAEYNIREGCSFVHSHEPARAGYMRWYSDLRARAEEGSADVPSDQQIRDGQMDAAIPLEGDVPWAEEGKG